MADPRAVRILHVLEDLGTGGAERQLILFLERSDRRRFHHEVCALWDTGRFVDDLQGAGIPVHLLGVAPRWDLWRSVLRLRDLVRRTRPDVIHATLHRPGIVGRLVGRLQSVPVVTTLTNVTYEPEWRQDNPHLKPWKVAVVQAMDALSSRWWGSQFVAVTGAVKQSATRRLWIPPERIAVIPRGIPFDTMREPSPEAVQMLKAQLDCTDAYPLFVNVGRLVPQKGQRYLLGAMRRVLEEFPTARLLIAGEGWLRPELERLIRSQGLEASVRLLGDRRDVPLLLAAADIFVFPSLFEGFAGALVEAMSVGKPCVASDIYMIREMTDDGARALLVPGRREAAFAEGMIRLATDREYARRLGALAAEWTRSRFDARRCARTLEDLYLSMANGRRAG